MLKNNFIKSWLLLLCMIVGVGSAWAEDKWVETAFDDLATDDIVVIVDLNSERAMSNNNGTGSAPSATAVTLNGDKSELTGTVASTIQWVVVKTDDGIKFKYFEVDFL